MYRLRLLVFALAICSIFAVNTASANDAPGRKITVCEYGANNRILEIAADGTVTWEHKVPSLAVMFEVRKNGNVIYAYGGTPTGVQEVDREHKVVFDFKAPCEQVLGFEVLKNGNILVGCQGPIKALEVNRKGEIVREVPLFTNEKPAHRQLRHVRKLKNGNMLCCNEADATVREVDGMGKVIWEYPNVTNVFEAQRLPNGNTLIACGTQGRVIEVTPEKKVVWEFGKADAPDLNLSWMTSIQRLKNGNLVLCNFIRGQEGKATHAMEVTRDKKVVWKYADHKLLGTITTIHVED